MALGSSTGIRGRSRTVRLRRRDSHRCHHIPPLDMNVPPRLISEELACPSPSPCPTGARRRRRFRRAALLLVVLGSVAVLHRTLPSRRADRGLLLRTLKLRRVPDVAEATRGRSPREYASSLPHGGNGSAPPAAAAMNDARNHVSSDRGTEDLPPRPPPPSFWDVPDSFKLHAFPRWSSPSEEGEEEDAGFDLPSIVAFLDDLLELRSEQIRTQFPVAFVYVLGASGAAGDGGRQREGDAMGGIWVSNRVRTRSLESGLGPIEHRLRPVEAALQEAWTLLQLQAGDPEARARWPLLFRVAEGGGRGRAVRIGRETDDGMGGSQGGPAGFPVIFKHGDYRSCNHYNYRKNLSIPLLTTCAAVACSWSVPVPNYATLQDSLPTSSAWEAVFEQRATSHPWENKLRQVVWRGSLTGNGNGNLTHPSPRTRLGMFAAAHQSNPLIDIGVHDIPDSDHVPANITSQILMKGHMPFDNFSNYRAILDIDGNSWSSRFGKLLCTNSVVVKVEPEYVDYFYKYLVPWKHYVPVRLDLSDLMEKIEWVLDPANADSVLQIIQMANSWCRIHMTHPQVIEDMLDVLNEYVAMLDRGNARWLDVWVENQARMWDPATGWEMQRLGEFVEF